MRPLLVGEDNPYSRDPRYALYPSPDHSAGGRLCRLIMGLSTKDYIRGFERVNLCAGEWSMREAKQTVCDLKTDRWTSQIPAFGSDPDMVNGRFPHFIDDKIVLLGAKVCEAFNSSYKPFEVARVSGCVFAILPHPSGRCRAWNEPGAFERARETLCRAGVLPLPPWPPKEYPKKATGEWLELLPSTDTTARRPAWCSNCHLIVRGESCPECGPQ